MKVRQIQEAPKTLPIEEDDELKMQNAQSMPWLPTLTKSMDNFSIKKASVMDIMQTVESPSHWRYFENKKKIQENSYGTSYDVVDKTHRMRDYSPLQSLK